ncbi:cysteine desulfurase [Roseomonas sp. KE2513]|uniref:cysteine desulfurase family protein n=1 Tax=Roseomonas sp. KE2513 TaxID=2479202 RepID=UPI0018DF9479|nr:cysteine desulfurase family protein [Roseomonas sp. KE2513]MBI0537743.1 cysteine desulfurase [Roseomonas sp. KE2513]
MTLLARIPHTPVSAPIYLDHNSTTRPLPEVIDLVARTMAETWANASSAHWLGGEARAVLEVARDGICELVRGGYPDGVRFTSGGTEANNTVLLGGEPASAWRSVITCAVEHASVLRPAEALARRGSRLRVLPVGSEGLIDPDELRRAAAEAPPGPVLVSLQWANSETGVIQPVSDLVVALRSVRPDAFVHSDAAQAVGRMPVDLAATGVDAVAFSGHKINGPHGTGALVLADPDEDRISPLLLGGGQEHGLRSGTHNLPGIAGLGLAAAMRARTLDHAVTYMRSVRDAFEEELASTVPEAMVNGGSAPRLPNTSSVQFPGRDGMELVARLDALGVACSQGSACSSRKPEPSHVLRAMGLSEADAYSSVRFSFSTLNTTEEAQRAARVVAQALGKHT